MNILYIITILTAYMLFMLIHKTEKKQNVIAWLAISAVIIMCYNIFICLISTFVGILCTLQNLSIYNVIIIAILSVILLKTKKIQKYYVEISDIIVSLLILIIVIFVAYKQYGFPFKIKYEVTDGSTHYFYADEFYKNSTLLYKVESTSILALHNPHFRLPGAYINEGILFKVFDGLILKTDVFITFDLFVLYMSGILFYYLLKAFTKENKKLQILAAIFSIIYMLGYPLNSMLYGYVYLSLGLDIVIAFLLLISNYEKEEISNMIALPILALISFGIFFTYAYFIPIIYVAVIIDIVIKSLKKKEKVISENNLIKIMFIILNPLILGITYFIILPNAMRIRSEINTIKIDGVIYKNYITNLLIYIPIFIAGIILWIKNKKRESNFGATLFILSLLFVGILFIGNKLEEVSEYFCFKAYYIIWPLAIYNAYTILCKMLENEQRILKIATYVYITIYVVAVIISTLEVKNNIGINDVFYNNMQMINDTRDILTSKELEIIEKVKSSIKTKEIYVLSTKYEGRTKWMTLLFNKNQIFYDTAYFEEITIGRWLEEKKHKYYAAYYKDYEMTEEKNANLDENSEKYKILYENEAGFILERK